VKTLFAGIVFALFSITMLEIPSAAQTIKVGVLPYSDVTASGGANIGDTLSRLTQAEIVHSTQLEGRVITITDGTRPDQLDSEKIIALGKSAGVDIVIMGTLLEAHAEESAQNGLSHAIFGQTFSGGLHSWKAAVTLQADIYDVATGKKLDSLRVSQTQSDKKVTGGAVTTLGSMDTSTPAFQNSTLGKALQKTIADLAKHLDAEKSKLNASNTTMVVR
jgi:Curli production assembly/transport component CsgG